MNGKEIIGSDRTKEEATQPGEVHDFNVNAVSRGVYHGVGPKGHAFTQGNNRFFVEAGISQTLDDALATVTPDVTVIEIEYLGRGDEEQPLFEISKVS